MFAVGSFNQLWVVDKGGLVRAKARENNSIEQRDGSRRPCARADAAFEPQAVAHCRIRSVILSVLLMVPPYAPHRTRLTWGRSPRWRGRQMG